MTDNPMQFMRRWAREHTAAPDPVTISADDARDLADGINRSLKIIDEWWEQASGRPLTEEEKFGRVDE